MNGAPDAADGAEMTPSTRQVFVIYDRGNAMSPTKPAD